MSIKAAHAEDGAGKGLFGSTKSHIVSRLNKSAKNAQYLADLLAESASRASESDWLEASAYAFAMAGSEEFEKHASGPRSSDAETQRQKWKGCLTNFAAARVAYVALLNATKKDIFKEIIAGSIDPSIRYAAYQSQIPRTVAVVTVAQRFFPRDNDRLATTVEKIDETALQSESEKRGKSADANIPNSVTWRKRTANIVDASIGQAVAAVAIAQDKLVAFLESSEPDTTPQEKAAAYDDVLIASQDAADATRHAIDEHKREGIGEGDSRMQDLRVANLAVNYDLVGWRVGRNRVLIGEDDGSSLPKNLSRKPRGQRKDGKEERKQEGTGRKLARLRERVVLYDAILQSIDSVKELPGAAEPSFRDELDGKRAYFQALKYDVTR